MRRVFAVEHAPSLARRRTDRILEGADARECAVSACAFQRYVRAGAVGAGGVEGELAAMRDCHVVERARACRGDPA